MSDSEMSDGSPVTPELDARMLADLRAFRARHDTGLRHLTLTIDELDMLLRVAAERDALKAAACAEWEAEIPAEIRERAAEPDEGLPVATVTGDCRYCGESIIRKTGTNVWRHSIFSAQGHPAEPRA